MVNVGVIAEFNPFHNGHKYILDKAREVTHADNVVVVMSGNYVQRGIPAIFDKSYRAGAALLNGADAVFELPSYFSLTSAETYARANIKYLDSFGCIDYVCFGCETDNIKILPMLANILYDEPTEYKCNLKKKLHDGLSFPKARSLALQEYCEDNNLLSKYEVEVTLASPNNILTIEYLKAIKYFNSSMKPLAIKRVDSNHSQEIHINIASASSLRKEILNNYSIDKYIPYNVSHTYRTAKPITINDYELLIGSALTNKSKFSDIYGINKDMSNRIYKLKHDYNDQKDFYEKMQSKNYTYATISRNILNILLDYKKEDVKSIINDGYIKYARLLGVKPASSILTEIANNSSIPIVDKLSKYYVNCPADQKKMLAKTIKADHLYRLVYMTKYKEFRLNEFERQIIKV